MHLHADHSLDRKSRLFAIYQHIYMNPSEATFAFAVVTLLYEQATRTSTSLWFPGSINCNRTLHDLGSIVYQRIIDKSSMFTGYRLAWVKHQHEDWLVDLSHEVSEKNLADILTKSLKCELLRKMRTKVLRNESAFEWINNEGKRKWINETIQEHLILGR